MTDPAPQSAGLTLEIRGMAVTAFKKIWLVAFVTTVAWGVGLVTGCNDDDGVSPSADCQFSGITETDVNGVIVGNTDSSDWCSKFGPAYPNPATASVTLDYTLSEESNVAVTIWDQNQGLVRTLSDENRPAGRHRLTWDLTSDQGVPVVAGIYCAKIEAASFACAGDIMVN